MLAVCGGACNVRKVKGLGFRCAREFEARRREWRRRAGGSGEGGLERWRRGLQAVLTVTIRTYARGGGEKEKEVGAQLKKEMKRHK